MIVLSCNNPFGILTECWVRPTASVELLICCKGYGRNLVAKTLCWCVADDSLYFMWLALNARMFKGAFFSSFMDF